MALVWFSVLLRGRSNLVKHRLGRWYRMNFVPRIGESVKIHLLEDDDQLTMRVTDVEHWVPADSEGGDTEATVVIFDVPFEAFVPVALGSDCESDEYWTDCMFEDLIKQRFIETDYYWGDPDAKISK